MACAAPSKLLLWSLVLWGQGGTCGIRVGVLGGVQFSQVQGNHVQLFAVLWIVARQAPLSMGFSRQEYWSGLQCTSPGESPNPGIEPVSPALAGRFFIV